MDTEPDNDSDDGEAHPAQGVPVAPEPDDLPNQPLTAQDAAALLSKEIG